MCGDEGAIRCFKETICQQIRGAHDFKIKLLQDTECFALKWLKTVVVIIYRYFVSRRQSRNQGNVHRMQLTDILLQAS